MAAKAHYACLALLLLVGILSEPCKCASVYQPSGPYSGTGASSYASAGASSFAGAGAGAGGAGDPMVPSSYSNMAANHGSSVNQDDMQSYFNQYFAALQAQQQAFQQQLQAQIEAQRQAIWEQSNNVDSNFGAYGNPHSGPGTGSVAGTGPQTANAGISLGPNGGFQAGQISPASPGIYSRFAEEVPPPSGSQFGVFSSSSSSSKTGPDGKQITHKSATVGVNDNGKVSIKTVHDP